jgi:amino acid adenylation domain-containing protein
MCPHLRVQRAGEKAFRPARCDEKLPARMTMDGERAVSAAGKPLPTIVHWLEQRAEQTPASAAFGFIADEGGEPELIDYGELSRRARAIAAALEQAGARGQRALLLHPPGLDYVAAVYGCFYAGVTAVPAYPPRRGRGLARLRSIVADCAPRFALTTSAALARARAFAEGDRQLGGLAWLCTDVLARGEAAAGVDLPRSNALALLQYTSGSTSEPKGVELTHAHFAHNLQQVATGTGVTPDDRIVLWLPPYHDLGLTSGVLLPVYSGAVSYSLSPAGFLQRPARWLEAMSALRGTVSASPNFGYELCARRIVPELREKLDLRSWRVASSGAERVHAETLERFAQAFAVSGFERSAFMPAYGLAEATVGVTAGTPGKPVTVRAFDAAALGQGRAELAAPGVPARTLVSAGVALPNVQLAIVDPDTRVGLRDGRIGEIWVQSPAVARGYFGKPELSEQVFRARRADNSAAGEYLRSGDLGFLRDGELFVVGRIKDLLIVAGLNYYPDDIEAAVAGCDPELRGAVAAFAIEGERQERLVVVVEADARTTRGAEIERAVRGAVAEALELDVHAVVLVRQGAVPRTSSGKVQRGACKSAYVNGELSPIVATRSASSRSSQSIPAAEPPAELVTRVLQIFAELLGTEAGDRDAAPALAGGTIGVDDDFFAAGGHSLAATRLISRVREQLGVELAIRTVFEAKTARALALRIAAAPKRPAGTAAHSVARPIDRSGRLPLSFSQERMWFLHQLEPEGAAYNVAGAVEIDGPLDGAVLARAFDALIARHEILRSNYPSERGEPHVVIAERRQLVIEQEDLRADPDALHEALTHASQMASRPFDVERGSLLRVAHYRIAPERHVLAVAMHHLISDAWSMGVLAEELFALYRAFSRGLPAPPPPQGLAYVDYAAWQRRGAARAQDARELEYWRDQLRGAQAVELPTDHARPTRYSSAGAFEPLLLPAGLLDALRARAAEQNATLFMLMLAAFVILLKRHSGQTDLVIGVPIANRNRLASEPLIGTLVNTLPFRLQLNPDTTFTGLLADVRETSLAAYAHQDLPFERLVAELGLPREAGRSPLVQVMFDFQNAPLRKLGGGELSMRPLVLSRGAAQFDLSLLILDTELGRTAGIEYRSELFEPATIRRMLGHFARVLEAIARDAQQPLSSISMFDEQELDETIALGSGPTPDLPFASVLAMFAEQAERAPHAHAVRDARATLSYRGLAEQSDALAHDLLALGVQSGDRVAIYLERGNDIAVALLAVLKTGAAYVPLDPLYPPARLALVLEDSDPRAVITGSALIADLPPELGTRALAIDLSGGLRTTASDRAPPPAPYVSEDPERAAYVLYTSGSTGRPKGVEVSHGALANFVRGVARDPGMSAGDRLLAVTTIAFDIAGLEIFVPLCTGASLFIAPAETVADGQALLECMQAQKPSVMQATPSTWKMLLDAGWQGSPELTVLCGGEALSPQLARTLCPRVKAVFNMYGPTETTIWSTVQRVRGDELVVPVGKPIDHTQLYVLDPQRRVMPIGVAGEIAIGGLGVANGYFRNPEQTAQRFVADPYALRADGRMYLTGDRGRLLGDGTLLYLGRLDAQIKIRGYRVEPGEIESVMRQELPLRDVVVIAREDRPGDVRLAAYCVLTGSAELEPSAVLRERLRRKLPEYMVPAHFVALPHLPLTPNGKIDRRALPRPEPGQALAASYQPPRDRLEAQLAQLWQQVLGVPRVGISDNFFELGGHSLLAVRLFAAIEQELGARLPLSAVLETRSLAELADQIRAVRAGQPVRRNTPMAQLVHSRHVVQLRAGEGRAPLFLVHGAGGNVLNLHPLAQGIGEGRAVYGFVAAGADGVGPTAASIEEMADSYLRELRALAPSGPVHVVGFCGGGLVAYEMARMLAAAGTQVGLIGLIDSYHPRIDTFPARVTLMLDGIRREGWFYTVRRAIGRVRRSWGGRLLRVRLRLALLRRVVPFALRDYWLTTSFFRIAAAYDPQPYDGQITIFHAADKDPLLLDVGPELGWTDLVRGAIEVEEVPGSHDTLALEPNAAMLAQKVSDALDAADERSRR